MCDVIQPFLSKLNEAPPKRPGSSYAPFAALPLPSNEEWAPTRLLRKSCPSQTSLAISSQSSDVVVAAAHGVVNGKSGPETRGATAVSSVRWRLPVWSRVRVEVSRATSNDAVGVAANDTHEAANANKQQSSGGNHTTADDAETTQQQPNVNFVNKRHNDRRFRRSARRAAASLP